MLRKLTLGSRRNDDYGERDENENGVVNGTLKPGEGFLPDYEDEGDAIVKSEFLSGDDRERSKSANSYKGKLEETNGSNGNGAINGSASNGKYFQGRSSLGDDLGVDDDDSDQVRTFRCRCSLPSFVAVVVAVFSLPYFFSLTQLTTLHPTPTTTHTGTR